MLHRIAKPASSQPRICDHRAELLAQVARAVNERTGGRVQALQIDWTNDRIVIRGQSPTYHAKQLAHEAALDFTEPPSHLDNRIEVRKA